MSEITIWDIMTGTQVSTALVLIAVSLVYIAFKLADNDRSRRSSRSSK